MSPEFVPFKYVYLPMAAAVGFLYVLSYLHNRRLMLFLILFFGCTLSALTAFAFLSGDYLKVGIIVAMTGLLTVLICIEPYVGLLVLVVFIYVRPQDLDPSLRTLRLISITGSLALLAWLLTVVVRRGETPLIQTPADVMLIGIFLIMIASSIFNHTGMVTDVATDFLSNIFVYFVVIGSVLTVRRFEGLIWLLIATGVLLAVNGIVQSIQGVGLGGTTPILGRVRGWGIFHDPNDLAQVLVILIPFLVMYLLERPMIWRKLVSLGLIGLFLYGIYLTNSRGGMISLAAAAAVYSWRRYGKLIGGVLIVLVIVAILALGPSRMSQLSAEESSASDRLDAWRAGLWMMRVNPLFGIGPNMFVNWHGLVAHNSFIHGITEIGFIGIFFWLGMIYLAFRYLNFVRTQTQEGFGQLETVPDTERREFDVALYQNLRALNALAIALEASLASYLVAAFFLSRTYNVVLFLLLAMSVALYLIYVRVSGQSLQREFGPFDAILVGGIQFGLIVLVYLMVRFL